MLDGEGNPFIYVKTIWYIKPEEEGLEKLRLMPLYQTEDVVLSTENSSPDHGASSRLDIVSNWCGGSVLSRRELCFASFHGNSTLS